ncbi:hypothetical protein ACFQOZ_18175 [Comamonas endophytica]
MLISAIGAPQLLEHLENFKRNTLEAQEIAAAEQFIGIIQQAYHPSGMVDTESFINSLQHLTPFDQCNSRGKWNFLVKSDLFTPEREPRQFLPLFCELFRLDTLPGWSFDIDETYIHQGEEQINYPIRNRFEMFQSVELEPRAPLDLRPFDLQNAVDQLHADQQRQVKWGEGDAHFTTVKVRRQVCIADVEQFKRLTLGLPQGKAVVIPAGFPDSVTLPAPRSEDRTQACADACAQGGRDAEHPELRSPHQKPRGAMADPHRPECLARSRPVRCECRQAHQLCRDRRGAGTVIFRPLRQGHGAVRRHGHRRAPTVAR